MNTILTDDERPKLPMPRIVRGTNPHCYSDLDMEAYADAREAAVIEKLAQQEPVAWWYMRDVEQGISFSPDQDANKDWQPLYTHLAPQQADRHALQAKGKHPSPCARFCESKAYEIEIRQLKSQLEQADRQRVPDGWHDVVQKVAEENELEPELIAGVFAELLPVFMADKDAAGYVTIPLDSLIECDSYDVHGSDFYRCKVCGAESGAGVLNKGISHASDCPLAAAPEAPPQADRLRVPDWRPIETAPRGEVVLLWSGRQRVDLDDFGQFAKHNHPRYTHWMPLPAGPAAAPEAPAQEGKQ